ncbi:hypothetical protein, partial [Streptomyces sp. NRRL B-24484]|uniref:hypothetical protein n=1 Tax=Streptomyces sp. NRRL B-24484 TaxID=1463833 RepID=UPI0004BE4709
MAGAAFFAAGAVFLAGVVVFFAAGVALRAVVFLAGIVFSTAEEAFLAVVFCVDCGPGEWCGARGCASPLPWNRRSGDARGAVPSL